MKVEGPNGLTIDVPGAIATGLVGDGSRGYRFVPEVKPVPEQPAPVVTEDEPKPRRGRRPKSE